MGQTDQGVHIKGATAVRVLQRHKNHFLVYFYVQMVNDAAAEECGEKELIPHDGLRGQSIISQASN